MPQFLSICEMYSPYLEISCVLSASLVIDYGGQKCWPDPHSPQTLPPPTSPMLAPFQPTSEAYSKPPPTPSAGLSTGYYSGNPAILPRSGSSLYLSGPQPAQYAHVSGPAQPRLMPSGQSMVAPLSSTSTSTAAVTPSGPMQSSHSPVYYTSGGAPPPGLIASGPPSQLGKLGLRLAPTLQPPSATPGNGQSGIYTGKPMPSGGSPNFQSSSYAGVSTSSPIAALPPSSSQPQLMHSTNPGPSGKPLLTSYPGPCPPGGFLQSSPQSAQGLDSNSSSSSSCPSLLSASTHNNLGPLINGPSSVSTVSSGPGDLFSQGPLPSGGITGFGPGPSGESQTHSHGHPPQQQQLQQHHHHSHHHHHHHNHPQQQQQSHSSAQLGHLTDPSMQPSMSRPQMISQPALISGPPQLPMPHHPHQHSHQHHHGQQQHPSHLSQYQFSSAVPAPSVISQQIFTPPPTPPLMVG
ncbi:unnamed protein product [Protopolystoma xenopodis]|uniref:Uncharacterized protein n=1 Tax=Protopolystoma xenopodis TaxID=117903 RepID=A0A3S5BYV5_9PLAT|nr:unnamed protein product [Protopolystoma xenopodis]